ncbi:MULTISPECIES: flagellar biosynthesis protein [Pseudomonas]|uniref:Flagellar biosynthesis protein n=2 Tax=Pseudomonas TaxID=286 RepID=A0A267AKQ6_PSEFR|nr:MULTISPECIES: flagellar biosynthesis protein [Pseudomonas]MBP3862512.1 flagellar biosynthesis protein [Pseudomonas sp.]MCH4885582.1 flagellar biosynthesis protein [Pseudomonas sp. TMW22080]MDA7024496.1 flagellar biosynthesis protein [Pseudomonas fragi]NMY55269.1 flagellar biosynthesis protein [Pseudomonas sp. WS 5051]PAA02599.1 flagellar biosynthesis protein [Pseudomonas fragi]
MVRKILAVAALVLLAGCATNRAEVDVLRPGDTQTPAPSNGKKVYISAVDDRVFQIKPSSSDIPSLKYDEIDDKSITERAIARKRNNFNMAIGDVLLPEGRTVSELVGNAVATAYRQAGYEVVSSPGARDVSEVKVNIIEFWSWYSAEGVLDKVLRNKSLLQIKAPGTPVQTVKTLVSENVKVATDTDWKTITESGLEAITQETLKQL